MNKFIHLSSGALLVLALSGCTVVPGSHMSGVSRWFDDTPEEVKPAATHIDYIPITPSLLSHLAKPTPAEPAAPKTDEPYQYVVGPGDVLTITVWEHPELTIPAGQFRNAAEGGNEVKADGTVFYPYAGEIRAVGKTTKEIKDVLVARLAQVIKNPQVDVKVADYRSQKVYVSGAVAQPGVLPLTSIPLTVLDAVEGRGGLAANAAWSSVYLTRNGKTEALSLRRLYEEGEWQLNRRLQHGDVVHVPRNDAEKIFVLGEVNRPHSLFMSRNGTTLAEALSEANGINEQRADGRGIYVLRNAGVTYDSDGLPIYSATVYHLNASSAVGFMLADQFELQQRDVVYVSPAPITRWNRFLSQLLPSITATESIGDIEGN